MKEEKEEGESAPPNPHMLIVNMLGRLYVQIWWRHHGLHVDKCSPTTRLYAGWLSGKVCRKMNVRCAVWLAVHSDKQPAKHKIAAALERVSGKKKVLLFLQHRTAFWRYHISSLVWTISLLHIKSVWIVDVLLYRSVSLATQTRVTSAQTLTFFSAGVHIYH